MWVKISIQETILLYLFPPLNRHNTKKNYHNKIRLSQRNPCKIKVFLGCPYYTAISLQDIEKLRQLIAENIAYYRKHAGLTQEQLAEKAGISRPHMGAIEAPNLCRPISLELLFNLADALGVEPYKLLEFRNGK